MENTTVVLLPGETVRVIFGVGPTSHADDTSLADVLIANVDGSITHDVHPDANYSDPIIRVTHPVQPVTPADFRIQKDGEDLN